MGIAFTRSGTLAVAWTRIEPAGSLNFRRVYFAESLPVVVAPRKPPVVHGGTIAPRRLPATGAGDTTAAGIALVAASILGASVLRRFAAR
jgi:hypothetical protein